ncbi:MAG: tetratricopeptide repeat protein, partial [Pseudomonadota bacterium]
HGGARHTNNRGGSAATDYTKGRLKMLPAGHNRIYTTLTDTTGKGVPQSNAEAIRLYRLAAAQGNRSAQANLAYMYENGLGLKKDIAAAKRYYRLAADQGDEGARIRLGALGG